MRKINCAIILLILCLPVFAYAGDETVKTDEAAIAPEQVKTLEDMDLMNRQVKAMGKYLEWYEKQVKWKELQVKEKGLEEKLSGEAKGEGGSAKGDKNGGMGPNVEAGADGLPAIKRISGRDNLRAELVYSDGTVVRVQKGDSLPGGKKVTEVTRNGVKVGKKQLRFGKVVQSADRSQKGNN